MDENDFKRLLDESAAETQRHIDARAAELQHHVDATFNEMGRHIEADFAGIRRHYIETAEGLRRHFDVAMEKPRHEIRLLKNLNQRVDRMSFEMRAGFAETWALLKSFQRPEVSSE